VARVGLVGGTFDPVHIGHLILAECAREQLHLDWIEFVPANTPPHKAEDRVTDAKHRAAMVLAAIAGVPELRMNTIELERNGRSYTSDTLRMLTTTRPQDAFVFILGSDSLEDLPNWHEPDVIVGLAELAVVIRPGSSLDVQTVIRHVPGLADRWHRVQAPLMAISSTDLRTEIAAGRSVRFQVPEAVLTYIDEVGIYR